MGIYGDMLNFISKDGNILMTNYLRNWNVILRADLHDYMQCLVMPETNDIYIFPYLASGNKVPDRFTIPIKLTDIRFDLYHGFFDGYILVNHGFKFTLIPPRPISIIAKNITVDAKEEEIVPNELEVIQVTYTAPNGKLHHIISLLFGTGWPMPNSK